MWFVDNWLIIYFSMLMARRKGKAMIEFKKPFFEGCKMNRIRVGTKKRLQDLYPATGNWFY